MKNMLDKYREIRFNDIYEEKKLTQPEQLLLALTEHVLQDDREAAETFARYEEMMKAQRAARRVEKENEANIAGVVERVEVNWQIPVLAMPNVVAIQEENETLREVIKTYQEEAARNLDVIQSLEEMILKLSRGE